MVSLRRYLAARAPGAAHPASGIARRLALLAAADEVSARVEGAGAPREAAARVAFAAALDVTMGSLLEAGCSEAMLRATGTVRGVATAALVARQRELLAGAGLYDTRALADAVEPDPEPLGIVFRGGADLSPQLLDLLGRMHLASRRVGGPGVTIALPWLDREPDPFAPIAERIERRFGEQAEAPEIRWDEPAVRPEVMAVDAASPEAEARAAAATIARALADGVEIDRIAIAIPDDSEALAEALRAALDDAKVPFSEARGRSAASAPEVRALASIVRMAASRVERDRVIELLRTPGLHAGSWVEARSELDADHRASMMAHRLRELPLSADRSGALFVEAVCTLVRGSDDEWMGEAAARIVQSIEAVRRVDGRAAFSQTLGALAHRLRLGDPSAAELMRALRDEAQGGARLTLEAIGQGAVGLRAAMSALDDTARAAALFGIDRPLHGLDELSAELDLELVRTATAPRGGSGRASAVRITSPRELAGVDHDLAVVMGLGARAYGGDAASDPWLDERTLSRIPASSRPRSARERRSIRLAELAWLASTSSRVLLTRSATDEEGRESDPPHELFARALEDGAIRRDEPHSRLSPRASITSPRARELVALAAGAPPAQDLWARVGIERERSRFFLDPRATAGPFTGRIPERQLALLGDRIGGRTPERSVSVTTVERAANCAFRAFSERVLSARRIEDVVETGSARDRGNMLHRALFAAHEALRELAPSLTREQVMNEIRRAMERELAVAAASSPLHRESLALVLRDALAVIEDELDDPSPLVYHAGERRFGRGAPDPFGPLELTSLDGTHVWVDGQIDRVDRTTDGRSLVVIDYKTGVAPSRKGFGETVFQLPLYAAVAKRAWGGESISAVYLSIKPGGGAQRSPKKPSEAILEESVIESVSERALRVVVRLWSGDVSPRPASPKNCLRCEARDLCRRPAVLPKGEGPMDDVESGPPSAPGGPTSSGGAS